MRSRTQVHACKYARGPAAADRTRDIGWFRGRIVRASRMSYCEIGRNAQNSIKLFHQRGKGKKKGERTGAKRARARARAVHNCGRIELSALNSRFYTRDHPLALSAPSDGDIINVNCTNCTAIARDVVFFLFPLFLSYVLSHLCFLTLSLLFSSSCSIVPDFASPFLPRPRHPISSLSVTHPSSLSRRELHLHLNLAVDLAVVRGHHSCRGKGRLQYF